MQKLKSKKINRICISICRQKHFRLKIICVVTPTLIDLFQLKNIKNLRINLALFSKKH